MKGLVGMTKKNKMERIEDILDEIKVYNIGNPLIVMWMEGVTEALNELWENSWCSVDPFEMPEERKDA